MNYCPCINISDSRNVHLLKVFIKSQLASVIISSSISKGTNNNSFNCRYNGFINITLNAVTPNIRLGKNDNLVIINLISDDFLVTSHTGIKNNLTKSNSWCTKTFASEN